MKRIFPRFGWAGTLGITGLLTVGSANFARAQAKTETTNTPDAFNVPTAARLNQKLDAALPFKNVKIASVLTAMSAPVTALPMPTKQLDPVSIASKVVPIAIRLGAMVSPRTKFAGGADFSFPGLKVGPFYGRIDAEAIVSANFGAISTLIPVTFNGVYAKSLPAGGRVYGGAGIGPYFGEVTRFGGKLFVGGDFNRSIGAELDVHFAGQGEALVTVMARIGL